MRAPVAEIFSSVQGEGPFVGVRQLFVRTYGCDLRCVYCDTPASRAETGPCRIEYEPGSGVWSTIEDPVDPSFIAEHISVMEPSFERHHSVSVTGGEPLLHPEFIAGLAPHVRGFGLQMYLETNGQRVGELERVIDHVDIIAMDIKLASSQANEHELDEDAFLARSKAFLRVALRKHVFVKVVCTADTRHAEIEEIARGVAGESADITFVLQPVTPREGETAALWPDELLELQAIAAAHLTDVRVIPQCHRLMGVQ